MINKDINFDDKFLVAGAGGRVGSAICRALKEKGYGNEQINCGKVFSPSKKVTIINNDNTKLKAKIIFLIRIFCPSF